MYQTEFASPIIFLVFEEVEQKLKLITIFKVVLNVSYPLPLYKSGLLQALFTHYLSSSKSKFVK